ncbi:MAG: PAS domain-containing protein [Bacteroidetes bacterium]|nr:PAS domain-containing protein [Bacteroidota bacterium]
MEASALGLWDYDVSTGHIFLSAEYYRILGYAPFEYKPTVENWIMRSHPDDKHKIGLLETLLSGKENLTHIIELRAETKQGNYKWISISGRVVHRDNKGKPRRIAGTIRDISERKAA